MTTSAPLHDSASVDELEDALHRVSSLTLAEALEWETRNLNVGSPVGSLLLARSVHPDTPAAEAVLGMAIAVHTDFAWGPDALALVATARTDHENLRDIVLAVNHAAPTALPLLVEVLGRGDIGFAAIADLFLELGDEDAAADVRALAA